MYTLAVKYAPLKVNVQSLIASSVELDIFSWKYYIISWRFAYELRFPDRAEM